MSLSPALRKTIQDKIAEYGVFIFAVSEVMEDIETLKPDTKEKHFTHVTDAYIYTVGRKDTKQPEMLIFVGPQPGVPFFTGEDISIQLMAAWVMVNQLVDTPIFQGQILEDGNGRCYRVMDHYPTETNDYKTDFTTGITEYYHNVDYELLVLVPIGWAEKTLH